MYNDKENIAKFMIEEQLIPRGISDKKVLDAMLKVPRHKFVQKRFESSAYDDGPLPIGEGQTISQPYMVAVMTEYLNIDENSKVLEIGTGSGYQTAILSVIADSVYTVERIDALYKKAKKTLDELGCKNIYFKLGDGTLGWEEHAPYDSIIVTAGAPYVPKTLKEQLAENGTIVIPTGDKFSQVLKIIKKENGQFKEYDKFLCAFVPLIGEEGWTH